MSKTWVFKSGDDIVTIMHENEIARLSAEPINASPSQIINITGAIFGKVITSVDIKENADMNGEYIVFENPPDKDFMKAVRKDCGLYD